MNKSQLATTAISLLKTKPAEIRFLNSKSIDIYFFSSNIHKIHVDKNIIFIFNKEGQSFPFAKTIEKAKAMITEFNYSLEDVFSQELSKTIKEIEINLL